MQLGEFLVDVHSAGGDEGEGRLRIRAAEALTKEFASLGADLLPEADEKQVDFPPNLARHPRLDRLRTKMRDVREWRSSVCACLTPGVSSLGS